MNTPAAPLPPAISQRKLCRLVKNTPILPGLVFAAIMAGIAHVTRYQFVEPEVLGELCQADDAPLWCLARTALVVGTQWGVFGALAMALAGLSFVVSLRWARYAAWAAMVVGGAGLYLYNTNFAAIALVFALVRLARLGVQPPHQS